MRVALALLFLLALAVPAVAETPRHTPGFPDAETPEWFAELLRLLGDPELAELLLQLASAGPGSGEALEELVRRGALSPEQGARISRALERPLDELSGRVDQSLLEQLERLLVYGADSPEQLGGLLSTLLSLRESGLLDPYSFIAAAGILAKAFRSLGMEVPAELSYGMLSSLGELLTSLGSGAEEPKTGAGAGLPRLPELRATLPSVLGEPGLSPLVLLPVAACSLLALGLAYRYRGKLAGLVAGLWARLRGRPELWTLPEGSDPVSVYWRSVGLLERVTGIRKPDHATHREYLGSVLRASAELGRYGRAAEVFSEITGLYEVARFAGESREEVAARARERFGEMVESLGRP